MKKKANAREINFDEASFTEDAAGFGAASFDAVCLCAVVSAKLGQQRLWGGTGRRLSHLSSESHGVPASVLCTERHSKKKGKESRRRGDDGE